MKFSHLLASLAMMGALFAPLPLLADSGSSLSGGGGGGGGGGNVVVISPLGSGTAPGSAVSVSCVYGCTGGASSNAGSGVATSSTNLGVISYNYGFNGTTWDQLQVDANKSLITVLKQGSGVISATNGLYSNLLQGNAVISATNGLYSNILQGNAAISATNGLYVLPTTAATWAVTESGSWTVGSNLTQIGGSSVSSGAAGVQKIAITGNAAAVFDGVASGAASPANVLQIGGVYNSTPPTPLTGQLIPLQLDANGYLDVNIKTTVAHNVLITSPLGTATTTANSVAVVFGSGYTLPSFTSAQHTICDSGCSGTSSSFAAAFPASGLAIGAQYLSGSITQALTTAQMNSLYETVNGSLIVAPAVAVSSARSLSANVGYAIPLDLTTDSLRVLITGGGVVAGNAGAAVTAGNDLWVQGSDVSGAAITGNPIPIAGVSGGNVDFVATDGAHHLSITCVNCSGSGVSAVDEASFVGGTSVFAPGGGFFQTTATNNPLANLQQGLFQVTAQRALFTNLRNSSGTEIGTASNGVYVLPTPAATWSLAATETHIGEAGSNEFVVKTTPVVTASAYSSGFTMGGLQTLSSAARVSGTAGNSGTGGIVQGLQIMFKTAQTTQVDVYFFDANPSASTFTDHAAFVLAAADIGKLIGVSHVQDWNAGNTASVGQDLTMRPMNYTLSSATTIYAIAVARGSITPGSTSDLAINYQLFRD